MYFVIFEPNNYKPLNEKDKHATWCGTSNNMYALDYKGDIYTCIRFMESSLSQEPIIIGNIEHGIGVTNKEQKWLNEFKKCERCNIFDNECLNCPIAKNCSYCLGCSYE
ncbi:MAG: SPASM domain-containing protein [Candidatus Onthovivens sp.]|nr:SPASM domain-containing protein [Candidatus Onthovivens sp.]MDY5984644.1 SPASM domain-containing protein [Candidatus Onthovivens sp.]